MVIFRIYLRAKKKKGGDYSTVFKYKAFKYKIVHNGTKTRTKHWTNQYRKKNLIFFKNKNIKQNIKYIK